VVRIAATLVLLVATQAALQGCGCGFDCSGSGGNSRATLTLGFSDEALEELKQVVIEVDSITFRRTGAEDVVVDRFTIPALGVTDADTFQVDLLQYQGLNQLRVIQDLELAAGSYSGLQLRILGSDVNRSFVQESDDTVKPIRVSGSSLALPGPALGSGSQRFTVVFSLAQALDYQAGTDDYLLSATGMRVMDNATAASISGRVSRDLFDTVAPCDAKTDPEAGNRVYLYRDTGQATAALADVFTAASTTAPPAAATAPYTVASMAADTLTGSWQYAAGFLAAGNYVMAFACDAADDSPVNYDGITIPLPADQVYRFELVEGEAGVCDLAIDATCQ